MIAQPPHRFMNLVYGWAVERVQEREQWDMALSEPLPGRERARPTPFQVEDEAADFMATMQMHQARTSS